MKIKNWPLATATEMSLGTGAIFCSWSLIKGDLRDWEKRTEMINMERLEVGCKSEQKSGMGRKNEVEKFFDSLRLEN